MLIGPRRAGREGGHFGGGGGGGIKGSHMWRIRHMCLCVSVCVCAPTSTRSDAYTVGAI